MTPPIRFGPPDESWSRFDVPGFATVYGAAHPRGAFVEALAPLAPAAVDLSELFDDVAPGEDPVARDWRDLHHMDRTSTAAQWRWTRRLSEIEVSQEGWYVDVLASQTISVLRQEARSWAPPRFVDRPVTIDASVMSGPDRETTCAAAYWLSGLTLDNGLRLSGAVYTSRHGGDLPCWALWVDLEGLQEPHEVTQRVSTRVIELSRSTIDASSPDFAWAAQNLGLSSH